MMDDGGTKLSGRFLACRNLGRAGKRPGVLICAQSAPRYRAPGRLGA